MTDRSIFTLGAVVLLITAFFSVGYHQFDEHFQILEFAGEKLGLTQAEHLPWEYHYQTRPTIQPTVAVVVQVVLNTAHITDPFVIATCLRILSALLSFLSIWLLYQVYRRDIPDAVLQKWFLLLSFFLWFAVYNNVRFASENWSGTIFLMAYSLFFLKPPERGVQYFSIGLLFGLSFLFRYQMGFAIAGFVVWLLVVQRAPFLKVAVLGCGLLVAIVSGILIDSWFYEEWTLSIWNDVEQDLLLDKLSDFGVAPWWFYLKATFLRAIPPVSLVVLFGFLIFVAFKKRDPLTWTAIPFVVIHSLIGHKETRYLFPLIGFAPVFVVQAVEIVRERFRIDLVNVPLFRKCGVGIFALNLAVLFIVMFRPADPNISLYEVIYDKYRDPITLYCLGKDPYRRVLNIQYYKRDNLTIRAIQSVAEVNLDSTDKALLVTRQPEKLRGSEYSYELIYRTLPEWVKKFNINNWLERTRLWHVYEVRTATHRTNAHLDEELIPSSPL